MKIKEEKNIHPSINRLITPAKSVILLSNIQRLCEFNEAETFFARHQRNGYSSIRLEQLVASDVLLSNELDDCEIERSDGKPFLKPSKRKISISHSGKSLAIILGTKQVAIDIETCNRDVSKISHKFISTEDLSIAEKAYPSNPQLLIWCVKECLFKICDAKGVDFIDHLHLVRMKDDGIECEIDHPNCKEYLCVRFLEHNHLLIAYIG